MKRFTILLMVHLALTVVAVASEISVRHVSAAKQIWCVAPTGEKGVYRLCVVTLTPGGSPQSAIFASAAIYAEQRWSIHEGRVVRFADSSLEAQSALKISGARSELSLHP